MSYIRKNIAVFANELTFIRSFIGALTAADSRITCPTEDLEEQFADLSSKPQFKLVVDEVLTLTFTRAYPLTQTGYCYYCTDNKGRISSFQLYFSSDLSDHRNNATRTWQVRVVSNAKVLRLDIGSYSADMSQPTLSFVVLREGTMCGSAVSAISVGVTTPAIAQRFCLSDDIQIIKRDRLNYAYQTDSAVDQELIRSKVFVTPNEAVRVLELKELYDISTVAANTVLTIDGKVFYSLDSHTLMEV